LKTKLEANNQALKKLLTMLEAPLNFQVKAKSNINHFKNVQADLNQAQTKEQNELNLKAQFGFRVQLK